MGYHPCLAAGGAKRGLSLVQGQSENGQHPRIGTGQSSVWVTTHALALGKARLAAPLPCVGAGWRKKPVITHVLVQGGANGESSPMCLHRMEQIAGRRPCTDSGRGNWQVLADALVLGQSEWRVIAHAFTQAGAKGRSSPMHLCRTGNNGRSSPMHWHRAEQMAGHHPCWHRAELAGHRPCIGTGRSEHPVLTQCAGMRRGQ